MMKYIFKFTLLAVLLAPAVFAQRGDPTLLRPGLHTGNRVGISFYNDGQVAGTNQGFDIRGEWPLGSGENYIGDCIPLIGVEFIDNLGALGHSVCISRGPRRGQFSERDPNDNHFWGWNPIAGFLNPLYDRLAMSHLPDSWPIGGWRDEPTWIDENGKTVWNGYFGRGVKNADQESYFWADDNADTEFNTAFLPDSTDATRKGMGLQMAIRGFQWTQFLAEDVVFWLYDIKNEGTTTFRKASFGTVVGTLAGGDGDSQDDLGFFDVKESITYSWDSDGIGNKGQKVGYVGYAFLESPGNAFDGIDNDGDSPDPNASIFTTADFDSLTFAAGDRVVLTDVNYNRTLYTVQAGLNTVVSQGRTVTFEAGVTYFREGWIAQVQNGVSIPHESSYDGVDNDLDGIIDENEAIHVQARVLNQQAPLKYINFLTGVGTQNPLIDEKRDNNAGTIISSWQNTTSGVQLVSHWSGDENANWLAVADDVGSDGVGPEDDGYLSPDPDGTEGNGMPDQGEPNFGKTDPDESDQIGLTSFNFFELNSAPDLSQDEIVWSRMFPGRFDVIPPRPQDGDFIYASGYFPLRPSKVERFSVALLFGEDQADIFRNKKIVQQIYNAGYKFPQPPRKPKLTIAQEDGKVVLYWDGAVSENSIDFITKQKDFEGYKIYRATDAGFLDARVITNAYGVISFSKPIFQMDLVDGIGGFFYPSAGLLEQVGGITYYLGADTSGVTNKFVDAAVTPGVTYYYAVCAYDHGEADKDIFPSENGTFIFRTSTGSIITDDNTGFITPGARPIGYVNADVANVVKSDNFIGTGTIGIEVVDDTEIQDGEAYQIVFADTTALGYTESWSLIDAASGDTLINSSSMFTGSTPIVNGFKVEVFNDAEIMKDTAKTKFSQTPQDGFQSVTIDPFFWTATGPGSAYNGVSAPYNYQFEFTNTNSYNSVADTLFPRIPTNIIPSQPINFRVKNLTTNQYVDVVYFKTGTLSTKHNVYFKENIGGWKRTWRLNFDYINKDQQLEQSGTYDFYTLKPFNHTDKISFSLKAAIIDNNSAKSQLDKIKVVPNPYVVTHEGEQRLLSTQTSGRGEREIRFTHVPPGSKIEIFTVRGEKIKTLLHEDPFVGDVYWNLRTEENLDVAYGVYVYHIDIPGIGTKVGKFALIK